MKSNAKERQQLINREVHNWYRFVLAFPDHLVKELCARFHVTSDDIVLDPFCGTGTTLVECKKLGIDAVGIDANPSSVFASQVKTNWELDPSEVSKWANQAICKAKPVIEMFDILTQPLFVNVRVEKGIEKIKKTLREESQIVRYIIESGMLERGWISEVPFYKSIVLQKAIVELDAPEQYRNILLLALIGALVEKIANVTFGPELYVTKRKTDVDVLGAFQSKVKQIVEDLEHVQRLPKVGKVQVFQGDSRKCDKILKSHGIASIDCVMTSPPYPTEKDYTRNTRLELVFLGYITNPKDLRRIKQQMIRSHSKGIYKNDNDGRHVAKFPSIQAIVEELREKALQKTYGFAKLYPRIVEEYFGGMHRHLESIARIMRPGGRCAYVLGEQRTYLQTYIPTAKLLGEIAETIGFSVEDIVTWRVRQGTTGSRQPIKEEILILKRI